MEGLSVVIYLVTALGLSFFLDFFVKYKADGFEQIIMRLGIGTGIFVLLGVVLDLIFIPLNIWIFFVIAVILLAWFFYRKPVSIPAVKKLFVVSGLKQKIYLGLVLVMFVITAFMYLSGSFSYPYLEDGDPWGYLGVSKVISEEQTFQAPYKYDLYAEPYTQGYQLWLGMLMQLHDEAMWTMKFFHNFWISLSILFFFFCVRQLFRKNKAVEDIAFFSTVILFAIPSWVTHFMFSLTFNMTLLLVLLYALFKIDEDKKWMWVVTVLYAAVLVSHLYTAFVITVILIAYYLLKVLIEKEFNKEVILAYIYGFFLSLAFFVPTNWRHPEFFEPGLETLRATGGAGKTIYPLVMFFKEQTVLALICLVIFLAIIYALHKPKSWFPYVKKGLDKPGLRQGLVVGWWIVFPLFFFFWPKQVVNLSGTADATYSLSTFFSAESFLINNTTGWGPIITFLAIAGVLFTILLKKDLFEKKNFSFFLALNMFLLFSILVFGIDNAIRVMPFRIWTFLAIFTAIVAGVGLVSTVNSFKGNIKLLVIILIVALVLWTSFAPKYAHQTNPGWPEHKIMNPEAYPVYEYIKNELPEDAVVVNLCRRSFYLLAYDVSTVLYNKDFNVDRSKPVDHNAAFYGDGFSERSLDETYDILRENDVEYVLLGVSCIRSPEEVPPVQQKISEMANATDKFGYVYGTQVEFLFSVKPTS